MKEDYLELIQMTKQALQEHFSSGEMIEATCFKPQRQTEVKQPVVQAAAPPPPRPTPVYTPKAPSVTAPVKEEEKPKAHEPKIIKAEAASLKSEDETLALLSKTLPHLKLTALPKDWVDLYIIYDATEQTLYQKLTDSLTKKGLKAVCLKPSECNESHFTSSAKLVLIRKDLLLTSQELHPFAKRDQNRKLYLGNLPVLIVPTDQELESADAKRSFWELLLVNLK